MRWLEPKIDREAERALEVARGSEPPHDQTSETEFVLGIAKSIVFHIFLLSLTVGVIAALVSKLS